MFDVSLVERPEDRNEKRRQHAHGDTDAHFRRGSTHHEHDAGDCDDADCEFTQVEPASGQPGFDDRHEERSRTHARGGDGGIGELDRTVKGDPVQRHDDADAGKDTGRAVVDHSQAAPEGGHHASAMTTINMRHHTSANAGSEMSLPRIAVKPQITTQK